MAELIRYWRFYVTTDDDETFCLNAGGYPINEPELFAGNMIDAEMELKERSALYESREGELVSESRYESQGVVNGHLLSLAKQLHTELKKQSPSYAGSVECGRNEEILR